MNFSEFIPESCLINQTAYSHRTFSGTKIKESLKLPTRIEVIRLFAAQLWQLESLSLVKLF
ncbi:MAG: hypothetical protein CMM03_14575 [Rhodopirellula sp.]|nr:hypothetical protein [Rhodopirellula sp.]